MRMSEHENAIFYACSLVEYIGRGTKNTRKAVVEALGFDRIQKIYDFSDVFHCENIDKIRAEFIEESGIQAGSFDNIDACLYDIPSYWDIGKVYMRIVLRTMTDKKMPESEARKAIALVFGSEIGRRIQNFNCAWYYSSPDEIFLELKKEAIYQEI